MLLSMSIVVNTYFEVKVTLKQFIEKKCIKQIFLANKFGIKRSAFNRYVNGSRAVPLELAIKLRSFSKGMITEFDDRINDFLS